MKPAGAARVYEDAVIEVVERTNNVQLAAELAGVSRRRVYQVADEDEGFRRRLAAARRRFCEQSSASRLESVKQRLRRPDL